MGQRQTHSDIVNRRLVPRRLTRDKPWLGQSTVRVDNFVGNGPLKRAKPHHAWALHGLLNV
jgi:hypothetical protein